MRVYLLLAFETGAGTPERIFEWGTGDELQVYMEVCNNDSSREALGGQRRSP